ncbi:hypothetical protein EB008_00840 [bacterium]|jgi:hypothetical protein|nr:hypothetical protein [bacterium]
MFIVVVIIVSCLGLILSYCAANSDLNSFLDRFSAKINILMIVFFSALVYLSYKIQKESLKVREQETTLKIIERSWLGINKIIDTEYSKCPNFIDSLYFDWQKNEMKWSPSRSQTEDQWTTVLYISIQIFQAFEDVLTVSTLDQTGLYVWIANFIQWCSSSELRKSWDVLKPNFASSTRLFCDYIFEYLDTHPHPMNTEELTELSKKLANLPEIKKLTEK